MEGLLGSCGNKPVRVPRTTKHQHHFLPSSTLHLRNSPIGVRICINTMKHSTLPSYVAAASVGESKVGHSRTLYLPKTLELWRRVDAVCFDSTVCVDEGIDELAEFCGARKAVAEWTARAMGGSVTFEEALAARLSLFKPSLSQLQNFLEQHPPRLSLGIEELVQKLQTKHIHVYLISGGFHQMIKPVASILGIPLDNIFANQLLFGSSGEFLGFDESPLQGVEEKLQQFNKSERLQDTKH